MFSATALQVNTCNEYLSGYGPEVAPMKAQGAALMLEDDELDAAVTQELLERCCSKSYAVTRVKVLKDAVQKLSRTDYEFALLDMNLPDSDGLETVREAIRANPRVPLIVVSGDDDLSTAIECLKLGAQDYLPKSQLDNKSLQRTIQYALQRKQFETELTSKAYFDSLTGLANRALLYERWRRALARSLRSGRKTGVLIADIDGFKTINDRYGHAAGDAALKHFADKLAKSVRESDIVARLGGDEFVLVLENIRSKKEVDSVRDTLMSNFQDMFEFDGAEIPFSISVGGATSNPQDNEDLMAAIRRADAEMYEFKALARAGHPPGNSTIVQ